MPTRCWCVAVVLSSLSAPAAAQTILSESEALARLSPDSPRVRAIRSAVDIARADVLRASRWPNPRVTFNTESVAGVTEHMTTVFQPLPITGVRTFEKGAASAFVAAASSRADDELRRARADLRLAYADLVAAQIRERELTRARDHLQGLADILVKREAAGDAAGFDRLRADREVLDLEADRATAAAERARAQGAVGAFFAEPTDPGTIVAAEPTTAGPDIPSLTALVERAEHVRGEVVALQQEMASAQFSLRAAGRRLIPEPEVLAGTKSSNVGTGDVGGVLGVQATLPLFDRARPERALAQARASQAEARLQAFRVVLRAQVAGLRAAVVERRGTADRYRRSLAAGADQIERIAQVSYDAGERGILELLDAYRTTASARARQAVLDAAVRQAEIELEFVSGWEIP